MPKEWTGPSEYFAASGMFGNQSRKEKPLPLPHYEKPSYHGLDESMDLSTKWRAPPTLPLAPTNATVPTSNADLLHRERKRTKSSHHHHKLVPRKRLHVPERGSDPSPMPILPRNCSSPDVIVLSDEDRPLRLNGHASNGYESDPKNSTEEEMPELPPERSLDPAERLERRRRVRLLREELRAEEMKLVLLKKLHQSQMMKENLLTQAAAVVAGKMVPSGGRSSSNASAPPPLVRSGQLTQQNQSQNKLLNQHQSPLISTPMLQNAHGGPPPLIGGRSSSGSGPSSNIMGNLMRSSHGSSSRAPVTTPPNMVMGYNMHSLTQSSQSNQNQNVTQVNPGACPSPALESGQTAAQRQAAAKLALRKQLEKTLLQIPPPKPPPPEMHFVPNANNQEFICLLGLEKVVDVVTDDPSVHRPPPEPFECVQCGTDFSPVWKWQDAGRHRHHKPSVICETCVTSNIKKALKAEHTNRLKTAFVKALQQEQEIEQRMSQASASPTPVSPIQSPAPAPMVSTPPAAPHSPVTHPLMSKHSSSLLQHLPKLSAAHQSLLHAQAQQLQHFAQSMQPQPAHMYPFGPLLAAQAYSYQLLGKNPMSSAELQRQYLLDMIPPRSLPQSSMNWKT